MHWVKDTCSGDSRVVEIEDGIGVITGRRTQAMGMIERAFSPLLLSLASDPSPLGRAGIVSRRRRWEGCESLRHGRGLSEPFLRGLKAMLIYLAHVRAKKPVSLHRIEFSRCL